MITIVCQGTPVAKKRPKFASRETKSGKRYTQTYDIQTDDAGKFYSTVQGQVWKEPLVGPLVMYALFVMPIPESYPKYKKELAARGMLPHYKKPDFSNLMKFVEDCLNGIAYKDDSQISMMAKGSGKRYGNRPRTVLKIWTFEEYFKLKMNIKW